jgi:hypothetical protein
MPDDHRDRRPSRPTGLDPELRRKLRDFGRALSAAIADSGEAARRLGELQEEGYSLYLLVEGAGRGAAATDAPFLGDRTPGATSSGDGNGGALQRSPRRLPAHAGSREPSFRMNGEDVAFLRSMGIDPTRSIRRRRSLD